MTRGFIMGALAMFILSGTVVMANAQMRELVFGVGVSFNGQAVQFDADSQPFIIDGRTFLPVRAIADIAGLDVDFDAATNTVVLTSGAAAVTDLSQQIQQATGGGALMVVAPPIEVSRESETDARLISGNQGIRPYDSVTIEGRAFSNPLVFATWGVNRTEWSMHLLNENYTRLSGYVGRVQGSPLHPVTFRFYGDDALLAEFPVDAASGLVPVNLDVSGVRLLRIEAQNNNAAPGRLNAFVGNIE